MIALPDAPGVIGKKSEDNTRFAIFSLDEKYRYALAVAFTTRGWKLGDNRWINYLMLNPSTADELANDPTIERCQRRAMMLGFSGLVVTNLFAYRATDPGDMKAQPYPVGEKNDYYIDMVASSSDVIVCGWGEHGMYTGRGETVLKRLSEKFYDKMYHLGLTEKNEQPRHPLYVGYKQPLLPFSEDSKPMKIETLPASR